MKRIVLAVFLLAAGSAALGAATDTAEVISFTGKAEYQTDQGWAPISVGDQLDQGTVISTGFKSSVVLAIGGSRFTVAALSRVSIDKLVEDDSNYETEMRLSAGKLKMDVKAVPGKTTSFTARSPTATASVRGTSGIMDATGGLQSLTGVWSMASAASSSKPIAVSGTQSARIPEALVVETPQQTWQQGSTITATSTASLAAAEAVVPAGTVTTAPAVIPATADPSAKPNYGTITATITIP